MWLAANMADENQNDVKEEVPEVSSSSLCFFSSLFCYLMVDLPG